MEAGFVTERLVGALEDRPVVFLSGVRRVGKSTLVQLLGKKDHSSEYFSLDDLAMLEIAKADPDGFVSGLEANVVFDEVQRVPELFPAIESAGCA